MQHSAKSRWPLVIGILVLLALLIGLTVTASIVRSEGWDRLWNRKKRFIEKTQPELAPALDEADKRIRKN